MSRPSSWHRCETCGGRRSSKSTRNCLRCHNESPEMMSHLEALNARRAARNDSVDEAAVQRMLYGEYLPNATRAERERVIAFLTELSYSTNAIARRLRVTPRTVQRLRAKIARESGEDAS